MYLTEQYVMNTLNIIILLLSSLSIFLESILSWFCVFLFDFERNIFDGRVVAYIYLPLLDFDNVVRVLQDVKEQETTQQ